MLIFTKVKKIGFFIFLLLTISVLSSNPILNLKEISIKKPLCLERPIKEKQTTVKIYLDRFFYFDTDKDGQGLIVINPPNLLYEGKIKDYIVQVYLEQEKEISEIKIKSSDHIGFEINVQSLPIGESNIVAKLLDTKRNLICENVTKIRKVKNTKKIEKKVEIPLIVISGEEFADEKNVPVSTGIPLPEGLLDDIENVKLFEDGKEVPIQTSIRSRWSKKGSIKWLGVDFFVNYNNGFPSNYLIKLGEKNNLTLLNQVKEDSETIDIENGILKVKISKKNFHLFEEVRVDKNKNKKFDENEIFIKADTYDGPYWISAEEKIYRMCLDKDAKVYIEENGHLKTTVRADGWAISEDGEKAGKFITRIIVYSGQPEIQVNNTFIVTWDTLDEKKRIRDLGIKITYTNIGGNLKSIPHEWWKEGFEIPQDRSIYFLADRWNSFYIKDSKEEKVLQSFFGTFTYSESLYGKNYFNWFGVMGEDLGIGLSQRHLFQLFPKEIEINRKSIIWHAWPYHSTEYIKSGTDIGDYVNLRWLHQGKFLDFQIPKEYFDAMNLFKNLTPDHKWRWGGEKRKGYGTGVAITGELLYIFDINSKEKSQFSMYMTKRAKIFEKYPHAISDPEWTRKTEVLETIVGGIDEKYKQIKEGISSSFDRVCNIIFDNKEYGQFIWPDGHIYYIPGGSPPALHRAKIGYHHGSNLSPLYLYLSTGEWKYWNFYESFTRHLIDHVSVNYDPWNPETDLKPVFQWPGAVYHCDGYVPWGSYHELWGHMGAQYSYLIYYYLTGDTRGLDLAKEWIESVLKKIRISEDYDFSGMIDRNPANGWMVATNYYADLQDARLLRLIGEFKDRLFAQPMKYMSDAPPPAQSGRYWMWTYIRYWRDPLPLKLVSEWVDEFTRKGPNIPGYSWPIKATDEQGKQLKAIWCHEGSSREVDLTIAGPMYGSYSPYFIDTSLYTNNQSYIKWFWFETLGLSQLRQWAHGHPSPFYSLQWFSDDILRLFPLIPVMKDLGLPEVPCLFPFTADSWDKVLTVFKEEEDRDFALTFWGYVPEKMKGSLKFQIIDPENKTIKEGEMPKGVIMPDNPYIVKIPKDNKKGEYILKFIGGREWYGIMLNCPLSDLPKEVYVISDNSRVITATRYYTETGLNQTKIILTLVGNSLFRLETSSGDKIRTEYQQKKHILNLEPKTGYKLSFCRRGVTSSGYGGFINLSGEELILSFDKSYWFYPEILKMKGGEKNE
ncbi:MAG: hypothetical protein NC934_00865 [Candidatus Omnitrophica bacterium]|nr:hypothetical protein [Candidatus Omnitrophota bacterium]